MGETVRQGIADTGEVTGVIAAGEKQMLTGNSRKEECFLLSIYINVFLSYVL